MKKHKIYLKNAEDNKLVYYGVVVTKEQSDRILEKEKKIALTEYEAKILIGCIQDCLEGYLFDLSLGQRREILLETMNRLRCLYGKE